MSMNHLRESPMKSRPSSKKSTPQPQPQPELSPQEKLAQVQAKAAKWSQVAADPSLSPPAAAWALGAAKSYGAAASLLLKVPSISEPDSTKIPPPPLLQGPASS